MIETLRLTAEDAAGMLERGEFSAAELHGAYRSAIDAFFGAYRTETGGRKTTRKRAT